jgi:5-(carboxyamino)imidazole ribonucleotide mutase
MSKVGIIMGSNSDLGVMEKAMGVLEELGVDYEATVVSAHRTPVGRGIKVVIAGAGGAAHLPGMVASYTPLPVIGVPVKSSNSIDGWDSILSILQMPAGVPVATVALDGGRNAGILAAQILAVADSNLLNRIAQFKEELKIKVIEAAAIVENHKPK